MRFSHDLNSVSEFKLQPSSSCLPTKIRCWWSKNEMKGRLLADVVIREGTAILELLANENKELVVEGQYGVDSF